MANDNRFSLYPDENDKLVYKSDLLGSATEGATNAAVSTGLSKLLGLSASAASPWAAAATVAGPLVAGLIGLFGQSKQRKRADQAVARAQARLESLPDTGPDQTKEVFIEELSRAGLYTPTVSRVIEEASPKMAELALSPAFLQKEEARLKALQRMSQTGFDTRSQYEEGRLRALEERKRALASVEQAEQMRGRGGTGLAGALSAANASSTAIAEEALKANTERENARRAALADYGKGLYSLEEARLGVEKTGRQALDQAKQTLSARRQKAADADVAAKNQAQLFNIQTNQEDIKRRRDEQLRQLAASRQQYEDRIRMAQMKANIDLGKATRYEQEAARTGEQFARYGEAAGEAAGTIYDKLSKRG